MGDGDLGARGHRARSGETAISSSFSKRDSAPQCSWVALAHGSWCGPLVGVDGVLNPLTELAQVCVDAWSVGLSTGKVPPGHKAL